MTLLHTLGRSFPNYQFGISYDTGKEEEDGYSIDQAGHIFSIKASSKRAKYFALSRLQMALESQRIQGVLGSSSPQFSFRPLVITDTCRLRLPSKLEVYLPSWFAKALGQEHILLEKTHELLSRVLDMGVNALIFTTVKDGAAITDETISWKDLRLFLEFMRDTGIKIGLHCSCPSENSDPKGNIRQLCDAIHVLYDVIDFVLIHQAQMLPASEELTEFEKAKSEIQMMESCLKKPLLYFLSADNEEASISQAVWMQKLSREVSSSTHLLFHAAAGAPYQFGSQLHPFFYEGSSQQTYSEDAIIPVLSVSELELQEPTLQLPFRLPFLAGDLIEEVMNRRHGRRSQGGGCTERSCGVGLMVHQFPTGRSLDWIFIWALGQRMWGMQSMQALLYEGISRYMPDWTHCVQQGVLWEIELLLRRYGCFILSAKRNRTLPHEIEHLKIELGRLANQLESFALYVAVLKDEILPVDHQKLASLGQLLAALQRTLFQIIENESQNHSLKMPSHLSFFQISSLV